MRLDKYLKVSRLIKRRSVAKEASDAGVVMVNEREGKASTKLKEGDILEIRFGNRRMRVKVRALREHVGKDEAADLYEVLSD
ncbi:MAG: RNA-binding S4 domain-containing protein [Peptostreptococcaceae bacterium]|nr:RNA-binding S4 domain-containing protein [Peptostreptococcaceae bacterium]